MSKGERPRDRVSLREIEKERERGRESARVTDRESEGVRDRERERAKGGESDYEVATYRRMGEHGGGDH